MVHIPRWSRLSYGVSLSFGAVTSLCLYAFFVATLAGLFAFNFITQTKQRVCTGYDSLAFGDSGNSCEPASIAFAQPYFTQPAHTSTNTTSSSSAASVGLFPWINLVFGDGSDIPFFDYGVRQVNYSGEAFKCEPYFTAIDLRLPDYIKGGGCFYCGNSLRVLCTTVDSAGSGLPPASVQHFFPLINGVAQLSSILDTIPPSAINNGVPLAIQVATYSQISGLDPNTLPWDAKGNRTEAVLGTSRGNVPISPQSENSALATIANSAISLLNLSLAALTADLNGVGGSGRSLLVTYRCERCEQRYKPTREIIAILISSISAVLFPAFAIAKIVAEMLAPNKEENRMYADKDPSPITGSSAPSAYAGGGNGIPMSGYGYAPAPYDPSAQYSGNASGAGGIALAQQPVLYGQQGQHQGYPYTPTEQYDAAK